MTFKELQHGEWFTSDGLWSGIKCLKINPCIEDKWGNIFVATTDRGTMLFGKEVPDHLEVTPISRESVYTDKKAFLHRIEMCEAFQEGTELGDAVGSLVCAARTLMGLSDQSNMQLALIAAENLIEDYIEWVQYQDDFGLYQQIDAELFMHFTGTRKLTKQEFEEGD